jgi:hypothetical protein
MDTCPTEVFVVRKTINLNPKKNMHFVSEASKHAKLNEVEPDIPIRRVFGKTTPSAGMETCPTEFVGGCHAF